MSKIFVKICLMCLSVGIVYFFLSKKFICKKIAPIIIYYLNNNIEKKEIKERIKIKMDGEKFPFMSNYLKKIKILMVFILYNNYNFILWRVRYAEAQ